MLANSLEGVRSAGPVKSVTIDIGAGLWGAVQGGIWRDADAYRAVAREP